MPFVIDSSAAMSWCFEDESTPYGRFVLSQLDADTALVPAIWPLEIANAICMGERRQRLRPTDTVRFVALLRTLPIAVVDVGLAQATGSVLDVARKHHLTSYDAAYLELAMREGVALATRDARLIEAARQAGVTIVEGPGG